METILYKRKSSLSPLIATILLIVVSVILISVVLSWGSGFAKDNLNQIDLYSYEEDFKLKGSLVLNSINSNLENNLLIIKNINNNSDINIIGYRLLSSDSNYVFLEKSFYFEESIFLNKGAISSINIVCVPSRSFVIQFITNENSFVDLPITYNLYNSNNYCLGKNIIGYWKFDGDFLDYSGNNNHGANFGAVFVDDVPFGSGKSLSFNGVDNYVNLGNSSIFNITDQITLSIWVKLNNYIDYDTFFWKSYNGLSGAQSNYGLSMTSSQKGRFAIGGSLAISNTMFPLDTWIHMLGTYDGDYLRLYKNSVLAVNPVAKTEKITTSTQDLVIGRRKYGSSFNYPANIFIRDVQIYDRALSLEEIKIIYNLR